MFTGEKEKFLEKIKPYIADIVLHFRSGGAGEESKKIQEILKNPDQADRFYRKNIRQIPNDGLPYLQEPMIDSDKLLREAIRQNVISYCELFIILGADVNHEDDNKMTPIMYAAKFGGAEVISFLIDREANLHNKDKDGMTALMHAANSALHSAAVVEILLCNGADKAAQDNLGKTAADHAIKARKTEIIKPLSATSLTGERENPLSAQA